MDDVRKVSKAYYNGAAGAEKKLAREFFRSLDANADGKVSRREYEKAVANSSSFTDNDFFEDLDADCNKTLNFDEVLALYYLEKVSVPRCRACQSLLLDSYFSCLRCQASVSYYLCCDCYGRGSFKHRHPSHKFVDTRAMLKLLDQILKQAQITNHQTDEFDLMQNGMEGAEEGEDHEEVEGEKEEVEVAEEDEEEEEEVGAEEEDEDEEKVEGGEKDDEMEDEVEEEVGAEEDNEEEDGEEGDEVDKCDNPILTVNTQDKENDMEGAEEGEDHEEVEGVEVEGEKEEVEVAEEEEEEEEDEEDEDEDEEDEEEEEDDDEEEDEEDEEEEEEDEDEGKSEELGCDKQSDPQPSRKMRRIAKTLEAMSIAASIGNVVVNVASAGAAAGSAVGALGAGASIGNAATVGAIAAAATCRIM